MDCNKTLNFRYFVTRFAVVAKPIERDSLPRVGAVKGDAGLLADSVVLTRVDQAVGWARKYSIFPYPFATACCAMEFMSLSMTPYDIDRFGALLPRFSPRQADLLMVIGTVTVRQAPILKRVYEQMAEPRWVMAFGACASTGGFYDNYTTLPGIDRVVPVDVYVPGCPPRPEGVLDGLMALQRRIQNQPQQLGRGLADAGGAGRT
jgi:NADH-quinone oxidoreductase subunit B